LVEPAVRIALGIEYAGAAYRGWQAQAVGATVQGMLEIALSRIAGSDVATVAAGRTDAGVHASAQVVHFDVEVSRPDTAWVRGVNGYLPDDIAVNWACAVPDEFHARFSAEERCYRYYLLNRATRPGALSHRVGWDFHDLDVAAMANAAARLVGRHDFSAFRAAECQAKSPIRDLKRARLEVAGAFVVFEFAANAFLHHMVRNMVGCLVHIGKGARPADWVDELIVQRDRRLAAPTFMADGLYLAGIDYAAHWGLPAGPVPVFPWEAR
jgi:tRNA pseudouridine38-40 synthase